MNAVMSNPYDAYRQSQLLAASPLQLVHLAYEDAIAAITDAQSFPAPEQLFRRKAAITKAQLIIGELRRILDFTRGGDLAVQLARLYDYMQAELRSAIFSARGDSLESVKNLLATLADAWGQISTASHPAPNAPAPPRWAETETASAGRAVYSL